jgi:3-oxoacyl-[acyl-carrier protein] reductase
MKSVLITGAASRLGKAIALTLAQEHYAIAIHYFTDEEGARRTAEECLVAGAPKAVPIYGNFSTEASLELFVQEVTSQKMTFSSLVNNVGGYLIKNNSELGFAEWSGLLQSNFLTPIRLIEAFLPAMKQAKGGSIVNMGVAGLEYDNILHGSIERGGYRASKAALLSATRSLAKELAPFHISLNMVSPGYLEESQDFPASFPMGRAASYAEVARLIAFLLAEENCYITGQNIEIAGGLFL